MFGWTPIGGTSASTPIVASMFALAGGAHGVEYPAQTLYSHLGSASLYDVTEGCNGKCDGEYSSGCSGSMSPLSLTDCGAGRLICNAPPATTARPGSAPRTGSRRSSRRASSKGGGPEAPLTEACAGAIFAGGEVCGTLNPHSNAKAGYYFAYNKGAELHRGQGNHPCSQKRRASASGVRRTVRAATRLPNTPTA